MVYREELAKMGILGAILYAQVVLGGGLEGPGVGTRPLSMGGTFIGLADDWTAIYWNPAGLARLSNSGCGLSIDRVSSEAFDGDSAGNPILGPTGLPQDAMDRGEVFFQLGGEPISFNKKEIKSTIYLPTLGGYTHYKGFTIGGGIYEPLGYSAKWEDAVDNIDASFEIKAYEIVYNLSVAKRVREGLSLGLGLNILYGSSERKAEKVTGTYTYTSDAEGDGFGVEGVLGALYQVNPKLSVGLIYRTGSRLTLDGSAKMTHTHSAISDEESDYEQKFRIPTTYGIGIAYRPISNLTLTCDWNHTDWTTFRKEIDFAKPDQTLLKDKDEDLNWKAVNKIRVGAEYRLNDSWSFRAGFFTDPSPVPDERLNITNLAGIDTDRYFVTLGVGYRWKAWQFDVGFMHTKADREAMGVKYKKEANSIHIASSYEF